MTRTSWCSSPAWSRRTWRSAAPAPASFASRSPPRKAAGTPNVLLEAFGRLPRTSLLQKLYQGRPRLVPKSGLSAELLVARPPRVSALIVSYNTRDLLLEAIGSVADEPS